MTANRDVFPVVHSCPAQGAVSERKAAWFDYVDCDAKARRQTKIRPKILRDVRLKQGESHFRRFRHLWGILATPRHVGGYPCGGNKASNAPDSMGDSCVGTRFESCNS